MRYLAHKPLYSVAGLANPDALFQASIFEGAFLDTRSSACYGVFLAFGIFVFSLLRAYAPRLTIMSIYGTIALDIYCVSVMSCLGTLDSLQWYWHMLPPGHGEYVSDGAAGVASDPLILMLFALLTSIAVYRATAPYFHSRNTPC